MKERRRKRRKMTTAANRNNSCMTVIRPVERKQKISLDDATLIAGFPGPGIVDAMSASHSLGSKRHTRLRM